LNLVLKVLIELLKIEACEDEFNSDFMKEAMWMSWGIIGRSILFVLTSYEVYGGIRVSNNWRGH